MATYFSTIVRYLGERRTYILAISTFHLRWVLFLVMNFCARHYGISASVWTGISLWTLAATSSEVAFGFFFFFRIQVLGD